MEPHLPETMQESTMEQAFAGLGIQAKGSRRARDMNHRIAAILRYGVAAVPVQQEQKPLDSSFNSLGHPASTIPQLNRCLRRFPWSMIGSVANGLQA